MIELDLKMSPLNSSEMFRFADVLTEDVMIVSYNFIGQKPVIFTKYAAKRDPNMN